MDIKLGDRVVARTGISETPGTVADIYTGGGITHYVVDLDGGTWCSFPASDVRPYPTDEVQP